MNSERYKYKILVYHNVQYYTTHVGICDIKQNDTEDKKYKIFVKKTLVPWDTWKNGRIKNNKIICLQYVCKISET